MGFGNECKDGVVWLREQAGGKARIVCRPSPASVPEPDEIVGMERAERNDRAPPQLGKNHRG
jgi:hypothetical protein